MCLLNGSWYFLQVVMLQAISWRRQTAGNLKGIDLHLQAVFLRSWRQLEVSMTTLSAPTGPLRPVGPQRPRISRHLSVSSFAPVALDFPQNKTVHVELYCPEWMKMPHILASFGVHFLGVDFLTHQQEVVTSGFWIYVKMGSFPSPWQQHLEGAVSLL